MKIDDIKNLAMLHREIPMWRQPDTQTLYILEGVSNIGFVRNRDKWPITAVYRRVWDDVLCTCLIDHFLENFIPVDVERRQEG